MTIEQRNVYFLMFERNTVFTAEQLAIVRFCAIECEMQQSGEASVSWMVNAWQYAMDHRDRLPAVDDILHLGAIVEPNKNQAGFRQVGVRVGWDIKLDWRLVPEQADKLVAAVGDISPAEWFHEYEEIHPFRDGNGRTGQILFNWLSRTLDQPQWAPNFWNDPRRVEGRGA